MQKFSNLDAIKDRFLGAPSLGDDQNDQKMNDDDEELYGDFEDLESKDAFAGGQEEGAESASNSDAESEDSFADFEKEEKKELTVDEERELNASKKEKLRLQFEMEEGESFKEGDPENEYDTWYELQKAKIAKQLDINNAEFESMTPEQRQAIEGYKAGSYVRVVFESTYGVCRKFRPQ